MYNVPSVSEDPAFNVSVVISKRDQLPALRTSTGAKLCAPLQMRICARWLLKGESNMAIVKVKLVSGFKAEEESLNEVQYTLLCFVSIVQVASNISVRKDIL